MVGQGQAQLLTDGPVPVDVSLVDGRLQTVQLWVDLQLATQVEGPLERAEGLVGIDGDPGAAVYTFAGGSLASARQDLTRSFVYLGIAAVLFVAVSLLPALVRRGSRA